MKAVISLGANIGDTKANLDLAIGLLREATEVIAVSSYSQTKPVGGPEQPDYLNAVVIVESELLQKSNATSFRLATVFGISPRMRLDLLVNNFVYRAITDGFVVVFEGHFKRNYIHVMDVVQAFNLALEKDNEFAGEIFNIGLSNDNISKIDLCQEITKIVPGFTFLEASMGKDPDQRNYIVSNSKIEALGFQPKCSLQDGLRELTKGASNFRTIRK